MGHGYLSFAVESGKRSQRGAGLIALEPRMMFDGAAVVTVAEANHDANADNNNDADNSTPAVAPEAVAAPAKHEVAFVDKGVENYQQIVSSLSPTVEVVLIEANADGVHQMAEALAGQHDIDAIHIYSHGGDGWVQIGSSDLYAENIAEHSADLAAIGAALSADGDILVYGCNVAASFDGLVFISALSQATGADVAASLDPTGAADKGGDWELEAYSGQIDTTAIAALDYDGLLYEAYQTSKMRFGTGSEASVNAKGGLQQPFYYNSSSEAFRKLTYSTYPLNYAIAIEGDGINTYNTNGTTATDQDWTGLALNVAGFTVTSGSVGYGTIIATGTLTIAGKVLNLENKYELGQSDNFIKITTKVTNDVANVGANGTIGNVRYWVGTQDDYVGTSDRPTKTRGNVTDSGATFTAITLAATRSNGIRISSGSEIVQFYSESTDAYTVLHDPLSFDGVVGTNPATSAITMTATDDSYGMYVRMGDIASGANDSFVWYYKAATLADFGVSTPVVTSPTGINVDQAAPRGTTGAGPVAPPAAPPAAFGTDVVSPGGQTVRGVADGVASARGASSDGGGGSRSMSVSTVASAFGDSGSRGMTVTTISGATDSAKSSGFTSSGVSGFSSAGAGGFGGGTGVGAGGAGGTGARGGFGGGTAGAGGFSGGTGGSGGTGASGGFGGGGGGGLSGSGTGAPGGPGGLGGPGTGESGLPGTRLDGGVPGTEGAPVAPTGGPGPSSEIFFGDSPRFSGLSNEIQAISGLAVQAQARLAEAFI